MPDNFLFDNRPLHVAAAVSSQIKAYATDAVQLHAYPEGGYDDVVFLFRAITLDDDQDPDVIVQVSDDGTWDSTHAKNLKNGTQVLMGASDDDHTVVIEVISPPERYVRLLIDPKNVGGDVVAISDIFAILRRGRGNPPTYRTSGTDDDQVITFTVANAVADTTFTAIDP